MKFRIYDKKAKAYIPQDKALLSASGKAYRIEYCGWENPLEFLDPGSIKLEMGMDSYDGSSRVFYEGDVFACNISGIWTPYVLRIIKAAFVFKSIYKTQGPSITMPMINSCEFIGVIHESEKIKKRIGELNGR